MQGLKLLLLRNLENKKDELGRVNGELSKLNDEIKQLNLNLEQKVAARTAAFQQANEELNTLFYRTSHDFRRPLTTILGLANIARLSTDHKEILKLFNFVEEAVGDLNSMLLKLQDLSIHTENGQARSICDFNAIVGEVSLRHQQLIAEKNAQLLLIAPHDIPYFAPEGMLFTILDNLVENALLFSRSPPLIQVKVSIKSQQLLIKVADNGQGIRAEYLDKVLDMYVRANERTKGNGLGLYVVKKLVDRLGGRVVMSSTIGEGTTVGLFFPLPAISKQTAS